MVEVVDVVDDQIQDRVQCSPFGAVESAVAFASGVAGLDTIEPSEAGRTLANLQTRLHDLTRSSDGALLHLDLHPANVIVGEIGPVVIDWCNAERGLPGYDVAVTALILAQVIVTPGLVSPDPEKDATPRVARNRTRHHLKTGCRRTTRQGDSV